MKFFIKLKWEDGAHNQIKPWFPASQCRANCNKKPLVPVKIQSFYCICTIGPFLNLCRTPNKCRQPRAGLPFKIWFGICSITFSILWSYTRVFFLTHLIICKTLFTCRLIVYAHFSYPLSWKVWVWSVRYIFLHGSCLYAGYWNDDHNHIYKDELYMIE